MIKFDSTLAEEGDKAINGFRASINRDTNQLVIDTGRANIDRMTWDLSEWTARYGKPVELSLALHISTMAPDFVYNFCMDDDLQTELILLTKKAKYENMKYSYHRDGASKVAEQKDIDKYYKQIKDGEDDVLLGQKLFADSVQLIQEDKKKGAYADLPIDCLLGTSIIAIETENDGVRFYKAVDKNRNPIQFTQNYEVKFDADDVPYFEPNQNGNVQVPDIIQKSMIEKPSKNDYIDLSGNRHMRMMVPSLNDLMYWDENGALKGDDREKSVETYMKKYDSLMDNYDSYVQNAIINNQDRYQEKGVDFSITFHYQEDSSLKSFKFISSEKGDYPKHNASKTWDKVKKEAKKAHIREVVNKYKIQEWVEGESKQIKENMNEINSIFVTDDLREYLHDTKLSLAELIELHDIFEDLSKEIDTYVPYIKNVTHHWYKDVYFVDDDFSVYDEVEKNVTDEYIPDSKTSTAQIDEFRKYGRFYYTGSTKNGIKQNSQKQPKFVKDEPWHYKVKNWVEYGYYFIYDGSKKTAENIEVISAELQRQGLYDPSNPLLLEKYASAGKGNTTQEQLSTEGINKDEIDKKAKEINKAIDEMTKGSNVSSNVRLQKIDFKRQNSLTAFSILEGVHTADTDLIYAELKEFLVELGYFKYSDFEEIETDVFTWLIPDYEVFKGEWPDPKYEKVDSEYGTYIRSKSSVDEQRAIEEEQAEKEREEKEKKSASAGTKAMSSLAKESKSSNSVVLKKAKECFEYILNEGRYIYDNSFGKPIPPTEQNYIDCSAYVSWVLYECGYDDFKGYQKSSGYFMTEDFKSKYGWTVISVDGDCSSKVQPGDIVARSGHVDIVKSVNSDGTITGYNCGDQSYLNKSNINGVPTTGHIKGSGKARIIRLNGSGSGNGSSNSAINVEKNDSNTEVINGVEVTTVNASDYGEEGYATITTVNGISYKDFKQGSYPHMGVSSAYSQMSLPLSSSNFGTVGCGATSPAILLSAYGVTGTTGTDALPYVCGVEAGTHEGGTNSCADVKKAFDHFNIPSTVHYIGQGNTKETIDQALKEGKPIVANVTGGYYSPGGHYITVLGYDDEENLVISNPCGFGIYGVCGSYSVQGGVKLDYFVNNCLKRNIFGYGRNSNRI